jgi:hypothetical protein
MSGDIKEIVQKLGRFDSITEAYKSGDIEKLKAAVDQNITTLETIVINAKGVIDRYQPTIDLLTLLTNQIEAAKVAEKAE